MTGQCRQMTAAFLCAAPRTKNSSGSVEPDSDRARATEQQDWPTDATTNRAVARGVPAAPFALLRWLHR
jgi:hypothetical protein